jgi:PilZ domain
MAERFFRRVNVNGGICTFKNEGIFEGIIRNISLGGLFVASDIPLSVMDRIQISISLPTDSRRIDIDTEAVVTRVENGGIAFKYDSSRLTNENFWSLLTFVQDNKV